VSFLTRKMMCYECGCLMEKPKCEACRGRAHANGIALHEAALKLSLMAEGIRFGLTEDERHVLHVLLECVLDRGKVEMDVALKQVDIPALRSLAEKVEASYNHGVQKQPLPADITETESDARAPD